MARDRIRMKFSGDIGKQLRQFATDVQEKAVRPAAYAGARILYDEMHLRVPVGHGGLKSTLYHWFDDKRSTETKKIYRIGVNMRLSPHWHLVEYGHIQYFVSYVGSDGNFYTAIRPEMRGKPKPRARASIAEKSAYYVPLPGGPRQVAAKPYIRPAFDSRIADALEAAKKRMGEKIQELMQ